MQNFDTLCKVQSANIFPSLLSYTFKHPLPFLILLRHSKQMIFLLPKSDDEDGPGFLCGGGKSQDISRGAVENKLKLD